MSKSGERYKMKKGKDMYAKKGGKMDGATRKGDYSSKRKSCS